MNQSKNHSPSLRLLSASLDGGEIPELGVSTIDGLLRRSVARNPKAPALSALGAHISYQDLQNQSERVAAWLLAQGLPPGARVAVALPNMLAHPVACLGIIRAGFTAVCVNPLYSAHELVEVFKDGEISAVFLFEPMAESVLQAMRETGISVAVQVTPGDQLGWRRPLVNWVARRRLKAASGRLLSGAVPWRKVLATKPTNLAGCAPVSDEQPAFMIYSGGTTGKPKGVPITHKALLFNVAQQYSALRVHLLGRAENDYVLLLAVPLYHILGLGNLLFTLARGGKAVLVINPRDTTSFVKEWSRHQISSFPGVNTLYNSLLESGVFRELDFKALTICIGAGMPVSEATAKRWHEVTGCHITEAYGMTETGLISCNPAGKSRPGSVGVPVAGIEISLRDDAGLDASDGEGEICVRSRAVMSGYWRRVDENEVAYTQDGFFKTGDIGSFDSDGFLRVVDRKKEMIITSGFKVFPSEVERVLNAHPDVIESAVVPMPDEKAGQFPVAYIVRRNLSLNEESLLSYCERNLAGYKRPRRVIFRDELPKSNVGKILRKELADFLKEEHKP